MTFFDLKVVRGWLFGYTRFPDGVPCISVWQICLALDLDPAREISRIETLYGDTNPLRVILNSIPRPEWSNYFLPVANLDEWLNAICSTFSRNSARYHDLVAYICEISLAYAALKNIPYKQSTHLNLEYI